MLNPADRRNALWYNTGTDVELSAEDSERVLVPYMRIQAASSSFFFFLIVLEGIIRDSKQTPLMCLH